MKKLVTVLLLFTIVAVQAQEKKEDRASMRKEMRQKMKEFTPEQKAALHVKKMTLALDLNGAQQSQLLALETTKATERQSQKAARKQQGELSSEALFELKKNRLDQQIAYKKEMKSILTEAQFQKWEEGKKRKHRMKKHRKGHKKR